MVALSGFMLFHPGVRLVFDVAASREQIVYEPDLGFATQLGLTSGAGSFSKRV